MTKPAKGKKIGTFGPSDKRIAKIKAKRQQGQGRVKKTRGVKKNRPIDFTKGYTP